MRQLDANQIAKPGFYWNWKARKLTTIDGTPKALPGTPGTNFLRVPTPVFFAVAPFLGALYVMFLPLIGFAMLLHHLANKLRPPTDPAPAAGTEALRRAERPS